MITLAERLRAGDKKILEKGKRLGRAQGKSLGMAQGLKQKQMEIAKKMLNEKMQDEFIIKITEITEEELREIKKSK